LASLAEYQFGAEFALFLAAIAGLGLAAAYPDVTQKPWARLALWGGFAALATSAFVHGSLLRTSASDALVVAARLAGVLLVGAATLAWSDRRSRWILAAAMGTLALGLALSIGHRDVAAASVRGIGAAALGAALLVVSRRAIATRVAATAAATLLVSLLVLGVGVSVLLQRSVQDEAGRSLRSRAAVEQTRLADVRSETLRSTRLLQASLIERGNPVAPHDFASLIEAVGRGESTSALAELMQNTADEEVSRLPVAYISANGVRVPTRRLTLADLQAVGSSDTLNEALHDGRERASILAIGSRVFVVAAVPVRTATESVGAVIGAFPLDRAYLLGRTGDNDGVSLALVDGTGTINVRAGPATAMTSHEQVVTPLDASDGSAALVLVTSTSTAGVDLARARLFRVFFVFALGGAVLALLSASVVGERIGGGLRRLTLAAGTMRSGNTGVRTKIRSEDEVGALSEAFDSMASSREESDVALAEAADHETVMANRLAAIVAGMGEALIAVDESGAITEFNAAAVELVGTAAAQARHRPLATVLHVEGDDGSDLTARVVQRRARRWAARATLTTESGPVPIAMSVGPLRDAAGAVGGNVVVIRDLRQDAEAERMKREFLSRVGHELRTPLTPIIGYAELLSARDLPGDKVREVSSDILDYAKRQLRVIEMIEFFAWLDAGLEVVSVAPVNVAALLADVVPGRSSTETNNVTSRVRRGTPDALADARWLGLAVDELIDNAIKFSPGGRGVHVTAEAHDDGGLRFVRIAVTDHGSGMSPAQAEKMFGQFTQGDESDTRAYGGLGLGLPFARRLAEQLGGRVTCETKLGKGSKFTFHLPAVATSQGSQDLSIRPKVPIGDVIP
jgi:PAS domain S-box-containing protein